MEAKSQIKELVEILESCRINPQDEVDEPPVAITINSVSGPIPSFTLGNFSMLIGKAKSKKTFLIGAIAASAITGEDKLGMVKQEYNEKMITATATEI